MELTKITDENREFFQPILPVWTQRKDLMPFGMIGSDGAPVATMILSVDGDMINVEWLFVHPDYRRKKVGTRFLSCIEDILEGEGTALSVSYSEEFTGMEEFLEANGFFLTMGDPVWSFTGTEAASLPEIQKLQRFRSKENAILLTEILSGKRKELDAFVEREAGASVLLNSCDPGMSFVLENPSGGTASCLLTEKLAKQDYLLSLLFNIAGQTYAIILLKALLERFLEMDLADVVLRFVSANESVDRLVQNMLGTENPLHKGRLKYAVLSLE